jgi:hypothetical protein
MDVLEHIPDPLPVLAHMITMVETGGKLIIANNFYPVIKCHLPSTFYLRDTFQQFTEMMGLRMFGSAIENYVGFYIKATQVSDNWKTIRLMEWKAKLFFLVKEFTQQNANSFNFRTLGLFNPFIKETLVRLFSKRHF